MAAIGGTATLSPYSIHLEIRSTIFKSIVVTWLIVHLFTSPNNGHNDDVI